MGARQTRALTARGTREQTHDDCQWLDEEDGEENVLGNVSSRDGCDRPPTIAQNHSRYSRRQNDPSSQNRAGEGGDKRGTRLAGRVVFS